MKPISKNRPKPNPSKQPVQVSKESSTDLPEGLSVLFQNDDILVVSKPPGLLCHSDGTNQANLVESMQKYSSRSLHILNRLDKEASGLVVLVEMPHVVRYQELWQSSQSKKTYSAITHGVCKNSKMTWDWPLSDKAEGRKNPQGLLAQRKECLTQAQVTKSNKYFSLLEIQLATGRQHQIRKHAALNKTPLVGDNRYNDPKKNEIVKTHYAFHRLALHCSAIELSSDLKFQCPIPTEFLNIFESK